jgi:pimeloyl-ACP methyl ester carboxylesterase
MKIALWGRSMGAVAALLYSVEHPKMVDVGVYDSPFSSLKKLALDLGC